MSKKKVPMYTPESHNQMFEIISALRAYAGTHALPHLAETLDDALVLLAQQSGAALTRPAVPQLRHDGP